MSQVLGMRWMIYWRTRRSESLYIAAYCARMGAVGPHGFYLLRQSKDAPVEACALHGRAHLSERAPLSRGSRGEPREGRSLGADEAHRGAEAEGARSRIVESLPAALAAGARRPFQPRIRAAVRDHGARALGAGS